MLSEQLEDSVRSLGEYVNRLVGEVVAAVEDQMLLVFRENKEKQRAVEREVEVITKKQWQDPARVTTPPPLDPASPSPDRTPSTVPERTKGAGAAPPSVAFPPRALTDRLGLKPKEAQDGCASLGAFLQCFVESVAAGAGAERGVVYICDREAQFLRCVASTGKGAAAGDVSLASAHLPCTLLHTGIAVNVAAGAGVKGICNRSEVLAIPIPGPMKPKEDAPAVEAPPPAADPGMHTSTLCRGRPASGVVCLYNKHGGGGFLPKDEGFLTHCCQLLGAALQTYPQQGFLARCFDPACLDRVRSAGLKTKAPSTSVDDLLTAQNHHLAGDQLVLRIAKGSGLSTVKDGLAAGAPDPVPVSLPTELKETVHYIESLEMMWRSSIHEKRDLQITLDSVQRKLTQSNYQLSYLETTVRHLSTAGAAHARTSAPAATPQAPSRRGSAATSGRRHSNSTPPPSHHTRLPRIQHRSVKPVHQAPAAPSACSPTSHPDGFGSTKQGAGGSMRPSPPSGRACVRRGRAGDAGAS